MEEHGDQPTASPQKSSNPMKYFFIVIVILLLIGGGYYLNKKTMAPAQQTKGANTQMMQGTQTGTNAKGMKTSLTITQASSPSAATASEQDVTVTGSNFKFDPSTITVKKGQKVKITFQNSGGMHDFVLDGFNVKTNVIPSGQSQSVEFTADKTGTFSYYCSVANHRAMGMQGTLTVQ